jgi:polyisoprenoid-binding protein YceI
METKNVKTETKTKWGVDTAHSEVGFKIKHLMVANVRGTFREYDGSIYTTGDDFTTAEIDFWINAASINTGEEKRDGHLRSPEFFDVEKFKEISFTGNTMQKKDETGRFSLFGELTMKDVKKRIELDVDFGGFVKDPWGNQKAVFTVTGKINRKDWGLNWNAAMETGGVLVGEDVWITCEIQLTKQA